MSSSYTKQYLSFSFDRKIVRNYYKFCKEKDHVTTKHTLPFGLINYTLTVDTYKSYNSCGCSHIFPSSFISVKMSLEKKVLFLIIVIMITIMEC